MAGMEGRDMTDKAIRERIDAVVLARFDHDGDRRRQALREFMAVSMPGMGEAAAERVVGMIPPVLPELYRRWAGMFAERLLETVPRAQVVDMCAGGDEGEATLALVFLMFMESERMEEQVRKDLEEHGLERSGDDALADVAADYVRARLAAMAEEAKAGIPENKKN